jgi:hypothetical protein
MDAPNMHCPRGFTASLPTVLVVVAMLCVFCGWLGWNVHVVRERKAVFAEIERNKGDAQFGYIGLEQAESNPAGRAALRAGESGYVRISFVRRLLGDESCLEMSLPPALEPELIERVEKAFPEAKLAIFPNDRQAVTEYRDSVYAPAPLREKNTGTAFKTGFK